ncbi:MAG: hypothetical protein K0R14_348 [Burkholderiales bacterium]|jgi:uncharacterized protein YggE|nr:hypothetical protein [Burkholderiales bacterium]
MVNKKINLVVLSLIGILASSTIYAETKTVTATGRGEVLIPQTIAIMKLSVSEDGKTANEAQNKIRLKSAKLLDMLKTKKTLNLETMAVNLNPTMSYTDNKPKIIGYNATYTVEVRVLIQNAGDIIDDAVNSGASIVDEPKLTASNSEIAAAEKEAIKLATIDAKSRAEASLSALGFKATAVNQITISNINNQPQPFGPTLMRGVNNSANTQPSTQIIAGKTDIVAEVNLSMTY